MGIFELVGFLIIGFLAGLIANALMGRKSNSVFVNLALGVAGAFVGGWLFQVFGLFPFSFPGTLIAATVGAMLVIFLVGLLTGRNGRVRF